MPTCQVARLSRGKLTVLPKEYPNKNVAMDKAIRLTSRNVLGLVVHEGTISEPDLAFKVAPIPVERFVEDVIPRIKSGRQPLLYRVRDAIATIPLTLSDVTFYPPPEGLADWQVDELVWLLGHGCTVQTKIKLRNTVRWPNQIRNCGILGRLTIWPTVSYCAGQDYTAEIRTIRDHILGRG